MNTELLRRSLLRSIIPPKPRAHTRVIRVLGVAAADPLLGALLYRLGSEPPGQGSRLYPMELVVPTNTRGLTVTKVNSDLYTGYPLWASGMEGFELTLNVNDA